MNRLKPILLHCLFALYGACFCEAQTNFWKEASQLEGRGQFKQAAALLTNALSDSSLPASQHKELVFEADRLERIKRDFPFTKDGLFAELKKSVRDLTKQEFERWVAEGRFDSREIDGERKFMTSSVSNLHFRYPELSSRRMPPKDKAALEKTRIESCAIIKAASLKEKKPYVLPKRFVVDMTVTAKPGAAPPGEIIRAWLPIPREYPFQKDFELLSAMPKTRQVQPKDSSIRSIYLEQPANKDGGANFRIRYSYTTYGVYFDINPAEVRPCTTTDESIRKFTREAPHVMFTPQMRALSDQIAGGETNVYLKAKKFYDWIAGQIKYSYAIEYSTIRNISEYCRTKGYGDCGQEAFLFITLCRLNGIPARWQTGWNTCPGAIGIHDWCEIYLEPHGWIPIDPYMGIFAMQYTTTLTPEQRKEVRDFYFGGLDWFRMSANSDHNQQLIPPKRAPRSDDVDFQRGELEWGDHNIYFDKYSYDLVWKTAK